MRKKQTEPYKVFGVSFSSKRHVFKVLGYKFVPACQDERETEEWIKHRFGIDKEDWLTQHLTEAKDAYGQYLIKLKTQKRTKTWKGKTK